LPSNASFKNVTWSVVNGTGGASISTTGLLTASKDGSVTVRARANDSSNVECTLVINISNQLIPVTSIVLTGAGGATSITTKGGTLQISAAILPSNASLKTVTWSVVNGTGGASISATGLLTASKDGNVTVKAKANDSSNVEGTLVITISNQTVGLNQALITPIQVYPNPATTKLFIENPNGDQLTFVIYDLLGKKILEKSANAILNTMDISNLKNGLYFITFYNDKAEASTVKFIKE
jgi:uncharacterized protein YjdB